MWLGYNVTDWIFKHMIGAFFAFCIMKCNESELCFILDNIYFLCCKIYYIFDIYLFT